MSVSWLPLNPSVSRAPIRMSEVPAPRIQSRPAAQNIKVMGGLSLFRYGQKTRDTLTFSVLILIITARMASAQVTAIAEHFKAVNSHDAETIVAGYTPLKHRFSELGRR